MNFFQLPSVSDDEQLMKCETYINIVKSQSLSHVIYSCYSGEKGDFYSHETLLYTIKFNRLHKAIVYDASHKMIGTIEGREREWNFQNMNIALYDYPTLQAPKMNMQVTIDENVYSSVKPKPKGFHKLCLDLNYLNQSSSSHHSNFKLVDKENMPVMIGCALYKQNQFHLVTNLKDVHACALFCVRNWT